MVLSDMRPAIRLFVLSDYNFKCNAMDSQHGRFKDIRNIGLPWHSFVDIIDDNALYGVSVF